MPAGSAAVAATPRRDTSAPTMLPLPPIPLLDAMAPPAPVPPPTLPAPADNAREAAISGSDAPTPEMFTLPANPLLGGLADAIDNTYNAVEPSVRALVEAVEDGLTVLGVPNFLAAQGTILYTFGEAVVKSVLFNGTDWLRGEGSFFSNMQDLGTDLLAAGLWLTIDELNAFGLLPPTPVDLPRPPINQSVALGVAPSPTAGEEGFIDDARADDEGARAPANEAGTDSSVTIDSEVADIPEPDQKARDSVTEGGLSGDLDPGNTVSSTAEPETDPAGTDDISAENIDEATDGERSADTGGVNDASSHGDSDPAQDSDEVGKRGKRDKGDDRAQSAKADTDRSDSGKDSD
ncbi:hypothetical protein [Mycolicibacterium vanbaalenii]|uniref:hypothetical protein n=1 Tax=Mycolicibacterium vanbaalenii TaxID=110539 RepID=UPI00132FFAB8|nr:hypothetical protein [Mycolicibacterium vanbaalenii]